MLIVIDTLKQSISYKKIPPSCLPFCRMVYSILRSENVYKAAQSFTGYVWLPIGWLMTRLPVSSLNKGTCVDLGRPSIICNKPMETALQLLINNNITFNAHFLIIA